MRVSIRVKLGNVVCAEKAFTVCAHPVNFSTDYNGTDPNVYNIYNADYVGLSVLHNYESDSGKVNTDGTLPDLDKVQIKELITDGPIDNPPFTSPNPTTVGKYGPAINPSYWRDDLAYSIKKITTGPAGSDTSYQIFLYKCSRCGDSDKPCPHSGFVIMQELKQDGGVWKITTTEKGQSVKQTTGSSEAGTGDVKSEPEQVPFKP